VREGLLICASTKSKGGKTEKDKDCDVVKGKSERRMGSATGHCSQEGRI